VWAVDFKFDATADGRRPQVMNLIDVHSLFCLAIRVARHCKAKAVVAVLEKLTILYPAPAFIRSDNGPEFIAKALREWCESIATTSTAYIEPGSPWENGFAKSFNGRFRDESLTRSCSLWLQRRRSWPIAGAGSTTLSGRTRPSRGVPSWRQLNRERRHDRIHPLSSGLDRQRGSRPDDFGPRRLGESVGMLTSIECASVMPVWPEGGCVKVFACLRVSPGLKKCFAALDQSDVSAVIYSREISHANKKKPCRHVYLD
jgi:hypothetical protein